MAIDDTAVATLYRDQHARPGPAYQRLKDLFEEQIRSGHWADGEQLPAETQLAATLGLSRMTVNRALRELSSEGLVVRLIGVGSFVSKPKASSALFAVHDIADEVALRGHAYHAEVMSQIAEPATAEIATLLDLQSGDTVFHSRVVHFEDRRAIQLENRFVVPAEAPEYLAQDFTTITPHSYLSSIAPLGRGEHVVEAVLPTADQQRLLGVGPVEPCLMIRRRTWSHDRLVSAARLLYPGTRYRLEGTFDAN